MCCDKRTENAVIDVLQQYFKWRDDVELAGSKSFFQGKSSGNQCEGQSYPWGSFKTTRLPLQR